MSSHPTVGNSDNVEEGARLFFESWLPFSWKKRKQVPDIHIDYRVEVVDNGEPTGLHFQAQVKGRSVHKRTAKKLSEPFKTKHLRYYMRCEEPVFLLLIDPFTKRGHWLFIQRYITENIPNVQLRRQKRLTIPFDSKRSCEDFATFDTELREAWKYMRDLHPGSPVAAILAEKLRLERLDPRFSVHISANPTSKQVRVAPLKPSPEGMRLKFLKTPPMSAIRDFYEKGESFRIKATEIATEDLPILNAFLRELGDGEITIRDGRTFKGCLQIAFEHNGENTTLQIDGEWHLALKKISFQGQLSEAPIKAHLTRERSEDLNSERAAIVFKFDWNAWASQPLLSLAYFPQIQKLVASKDFSLRSFIRGNEPWKVELFTVETVAAKKAMEALNWLERCRRVVQEFKFNPLFPADGATNELETDDVRLFVQLFEKGKYEQSHVGLTSEIEADIPSEAPQPLIEASRIELPEPVRYFNFLGEKLPLGPLRHVWTDVRLVKKRPLKYPRFALTWQGQPSSNYTIDYEGFRSKIASGLAVP